MNSLRSNIQGLLDDPEEFAESAIFKLFLSGLIITSVLPFNWVQMLWPGFLSIFAVELCLRVRVLFINIEHKTVNKFEVAVLILDIIAILSFLPIDTFYENVRFLRLARLSRMLLLVGYWAPVVRHVWFIAVKRERRYQLTFVFISAVLLTFVSAILMDQFQLSQIDLNNDGDLSNDHSFGTLLWWSFRQIQDTGNMLANPKASLALFFSIILTLSGMFLFSFLIGIASSIVEELVTESKERPMGMRKHTVLCNVDSKSGPLLKDLAKYYRKSHRFARISTMGSAKTRFGYMADDALRRVRYTQGRPINPHALKKVDAEEANRIIILNNSESTMSDSEVISQILSVRKFNPHCDIFAEIHSINNREAAIEAGQPNIETKAGSQSTALRTGKHNTQYVAGRNNLNNDDALTAPILVHRLIGRYLANLFLHPGLEDIYDKLLTSNSKEIYTCIYGVGNMKKHPRPETPEPISEQRLVQCYKTHHVILLGHCVDDTTTAEKFAPRFLKQPNDSETGHDDTFTSHQIAGYFGIAESFKKIKKSAIVPATNRLQAIVARCKCILDRTKSGIADRLERIATLAQKLIKPRQGVVSEHPQFSLPAMAVCPVKHHPKQILICGFHTGVIEFCKQLVRNDKNGVSITIMIPDEEHSLAVRKAFCQNSHSELPGGTPQQTVKFIGKSNGSLTYKVAGPPGHRDGSIQLTIGDWSAGRDFLDLHNSDIELEKLDSILFTYSDREPDPDARTALALLKLMSLPKSPFPDDSRILCELFSKGKAELFKQKLCRYEQKKDKSSRKNGICSTITVVSAKHLRDSLTAQSIFVRGIDLIYDELFNVSQNNLFKLIVKTPCDRNRPRDFGEVLEQLYSKTGLVAIGVETETTDPQNSSRETHINPERVASRKLFNGEKKWTGIYAIGDPFNIRKYPKPCEGCDFKSACP